MNTHTLLAHAAVILVTVTAAGQGTFLYDQQSSATDSGGEGVGPVQPNQPLGQSFTPMLTSVAFVRLFLDDYTGVNGLGGTAYLNLRSNSISGPIMGSTIPVAIPDGFSGRVDFLFPSAVLVMPGSIYAFEVVASGETLGIIGASNPYSGGVAFYRGVGYPNEDLWFREGTFVPEPSVLALLVLAVPFFTHTRKTNRRNIACK